MSIAIGDRIRMERNKKGYTQAKLSEITDICTSDISNYERGNKEIGWERAARIADALDTNAEYIMLGIKTYRLNNDDNNINSNSSNEETFSGKLEDYGDDAVNAFLILFSTNVLRYDKKDGVLFIPRHLQMCYDEMNLLLSYLRDPNKLVNETEREIIIKQFETLKDNYRDYLINKHKELEDK